MRTIARQIQFLFILFILCSCSFYSMSGSIPPHIKTIAIPLIENETSEFGIAEDITDGLLKVLTRKDS